MSGNKENREEYPFRKPSIAPFLVGLPVLLFFVCYMPTPNLMQGLSTVVLLIGVLFYFLTRGRFKGLLIEGETLQVTNGLRTIQSLQLEEIEKVSKDGASFAVDYKDVKTGKLTRLSVFKGKFSEETWQALSRKLSSMR